MAGVGDSKKATGLLPYKGETSRRVSEDAPVAVACSGGSVESGAEMQPVTRPGQAGVNQASVADGSPTGRAG